jgi:Mn-dependent DtxR family transcriptional regulator
MPVARTSIDTFHGEVVDTLGDRQRRVFNMLSMLSEATNSEIARALAFPINTVTPRVLELRKLGLVEHARTRPCHVTGRNAKAWRVKHGQMSLL